jgi:hypothetical protein
MIKKPVAKKFKPAESSSSSDDSDQEEIKNATNEEQADEPEESDEATLIEPKEEVYKKIISKLEILDIQFHPEQSNLIFLGLINGKLKM